MYIEFGLPKDLDGQAAAYVNQVLISELDRWSKQYNIPYISKNIKYTKRVAFDDDANCSFFALTWSPGPIDPAHFKSYLLNYRLIEPMNRV
jgi:hypothetical protein